jgi:hypothetical protein
MKFHSNYIYVLELEKCYTQMPSPQSPVFPEDSRNRNTSHDPSSGDTNKHRHIQVFIYSYSVTSQ